MCATFGNSNTIPSFREIFKRDTGSTFLLYCISTLVSLFQIVFVTLLYFKYIMQYLCILWDMAKKKHCKPPIVNRKMTKSVGENKKQPTLCLLQFLDVSLPQEEREQNFQGRTDSVGNNNLQNEHSLILNEELEPSTAFCTSELVTNISYSPIWYTWYGCTCTTKSIHYSTSWFQDSFRFYVQTIYNKPEERDFLRI